MWKENTEMKNEMEGRVTATRGLQGHSVVTSAGQSSTWQMWLQQVSAGCCLKVLGWLMDAKTRHSFKKDACINTSWADSVSLRQTLDNQQVTGEVFSSGILQCGLTMIEHHAKTLCLSQVCLIRPKPYTYWLSLLTRHNLCLSLLTLVGLYLYILTSLMSNGKLTIHTLCYIWVVLQYMHLVFSEASLYHIKIWAGETHYFPLNIECDESMTW